MTTKEGGRIKQEIGNGNSLRTSFAYTTKDFKIGKFNFAGSFKRSDGLIDQTPSKGLFYYLKWQKQFKNHIFSLSAFGAPKNMIKENIKQEWLFMIKNLPLIKELM